MSKALLKSSKQLTTFSPESRALGYCFLSTNCARENFEELFF